jgi:HTH-type transcriptional regulator / antitoxin HigA
MASRSFSEYRPDSVSPPGATLLEVLEERGMSQRDFALRTGVSIKHISNLITGKAGISAEMALTLETALQIPARFWLAREARYQEYLARRRSDHALEQEKHFLQKFPLKAMQMFGFLTAPPDTTQRVRKLLSFFGVDRPENFELWWTAQQPAFKRSLLHEPNTYALAAWLRQGELLARNIPCQPFNAAAFREALGEARCLTVLAPETALQRLTGICSECGVVVVVVPELPGCHVSGATRWLSSSTALIQLSLRYRTDDMFWFAFFHETAHVLQQAKRATFLQEGPAASEGDEQRADQFAANMLLEPKSYRAFARMRLSGAEVKRFAADQRIAPGIVVGRLQHDSYLPYTCLNGLKRSLTWTCDAQARWVVTEAKPKRRPVAR